MFFCSQLFFFLYPGLKKIFGCCIVQSPHVYPVINHNLQICSHCLPKVSSPPSTTSVLCSWLHDSLTAQKKPWMLKKWSGAVPHLHAYACVDQGFPWMGAHGWAGWGADQPCWGFAGAGTGGPGGILGRWGVQGAGVSQSCWCPEERVCPALMCLWLDLEVGHGGGWASALARHSHCAAFIWIGLTPTLLLDTSTECTAASVLVLTALLSSQATLEHNVNFNTLYWGDLLQPAAHRQDIYGLLLNNLWL